MTLYLCRCSTAATAELEVAVKDKRDEAPAGYSLEALAVTRRSARSQRQDRRKLEL